MRVRSVAGVSDVPDASHAPHAPQAPHVSDEWVSHPEPALQVFNEPHDRRSHVHHQSLLVRR